MIRILAVISLFAIACSDDGAGGPFVDSRVERREVPFGWSSELDLLIVVDRSPAMAPFRANTDALAAQLVAAFETSARSTPSKPSSPR